MDRQFDMEGAKTATQSSAVRGNARGGQRLEPGVRPAVGNQPSQAHQGGRQSEGEVQVRNGDPPQWVQCEKRSDVWKHFLIDKKQQEES